MGSHDPNLSHVQINYSVEHWLAFGAHNYTRSTLTQDGTANYLSANLLLKRWNGNKFQANIYSILGVGHSELSDDSDTSGLAGLQFDIEDREYYFLVKHHELHSKNNYELRSSVVRLGFAPYVGKFEDIHTWFILQWDKIDFYREKNQEDLSPYIRIFYKNILFEIGHSFNGKSRFNYTIHF